MRPLIIGKRSHQFLEIVLLLDHFAIRAGLGGKDNKSLSFRGLVRQSHCLVQMLEEFLGGRTGIGPRQLRRGELGVERNGFVKVLDRILGLKLLGKVASREEFFSRVFGLGRDRNLAAASRSQPTFPRCSTCRKRSTLLRSTPAQPIPSS